ncbi:ribbon-helix-helix domain-containing protein [Nocardioides marmorisolisilvae]|uniref:CopG family transcriptional regulator n=1 Tax=Nocardioides marmorisolisilvae TaxID=1542737 RepID=A0A3N0DSS1_9ACTN|nr:ribbon-helix-helix domain-containing protein [Nocardioides marmorisolisilvae]RNL78561.1 CopG family transcriptional regulator [Nocardioides marmorisolisilvae]
MIETSTFRRVAATLTIGSFSIAALMGIAALLGAGDFGETQGKILLTTLIVGCASICTLCDLATSGTRWGPVGLIGAIATAVPTATALHLVWQDWNHVPDQELKVFGVGVVAAVTLSQICLLLALAGARESLRLVLWGTVVLAVVVAVIVSGMITGAIDGNDIWREFGVAAILDVLGTLVTIALAKFGHHAETPRPGRVQLTLGEDQAARVSELAQRTGRSVDAVVAEAVDHYLGSQVRS